MSSPVLNWDISYHIIFSNKPLFPIEPLIYRCTCFVRDVHPHVSKLDPKVLKCIFLGYSRFQKAIDVTILVFVGIWFWLMSHFLRMYLSLYLPAYTSQGEEDILLVYTLASPIVSP